MIFDLWNQLKQKIQATRLKKQADKKQASKFYINNGEMWYVHLWQNIGFEQNGKGDGFLRPVYVLKRVGNVYIVIPMTSWGKDSRYYYTLPDHYFDKTSCLILSQIRAIDRSRFIDRIGKVKVEDYRAIKEKLKALLEL